MRSIRDSSLKVALHQGPTIIPLNMPRIKKAELPPYTRLHSNGLYELRYPLYKNPEGKWVYDNRRLRSPEEAWQIYRHLEATQGERKLNKGSEQTLHHFLTTWLNAKKVQPTTTKENLRLAGIICDQIGSKKLRQIGLDDLWQALEAFDKYAHRSKKMALALLKSAFKHAKMRGWIIDNPSEGITLDRQTTAKTGKALSRDQLWEFQRACKPRRYWLLIALCAACGLRIGEAMALQLSDYRKPKDSPPYIYIHRTFRGRNQDSEFVDRTKSPAGNRRYYLPPDLVEVLDDWLAQRSTESKLKGYTPNDFLFPSSIGTPPDYDNIRREFKLALDSFRPKSKTGKPGPLPEHLEGLRRHDLRHTWNTLAYEAGVNQEVRAALMGHSLTANVNQLYLHIQDSHLQAAASLLGGFVPPEWHTYPIAKLLGKTLGNAKMTKKGTG